MAQVLLYVSFALFSMLALGAQYEKEETRDHTRNEERALLTKHRDYASMFGSRTRADLETLFVKGDGSEGFYATKAKGRSTGRQLAESGKVVWTSLSACILQGFFETHQGTGISAPLKFIQECSSNCCYYGRGSTEAEMTSDDSYEITHFMTTQCSGTSAGDEGTTSGTEPWTSLAACIRAGFDELGDELKYVQGASIHGTKMCQFYKDGSSSDILSAGDSYCIGSASACHCSSGLMESEGDINRLGKLLRRSD